MTKSDAYIQMKLGNKITHTYFTSNEYLYMENDTIFTEDSYRFNDEWNRRTDAIWQSGWEIKI